MSLNVANFLAFICCLKRANGKAARVSKPIINASHMMYSGCEGYSRNSEIDVENNIILPEKIVVDMINDIIPVLNTLFWSDLFLSEKWKNEVSIPYVNTINRKEMYA